MSRFQTLYVTKYLQCYLQNLLITKDCSLFHLIVSCVQIPFLPFMVLQFIKSSRASTPNDFSFINLQLQIPNMIEWKHTCSFLFSMTFQTQSYLRNSKIIFFSMTHDLITYPNHDPAICHPSIVFARLALHCCETLDIWANIYVP